MNVIRGGSQPSAQGPEVYFTPAANGGWRKGLSTLQSTRSFLRVGEARK